MKLSSKNIDIIPLSLNNLRLFIKSRSQFEEKQNLKISGKELADAYKEELNEVIERTPDAWDNNCTDYLFYTLWVLVHKQQKAIVGQFTFNGKPNENGEVEVFFSIEKPHRQNGYATEVMKTILEWASQDNIFKVVLVEADLKNKAAMASLKKLGFRKLEQNDEESDVEPTKYYKRIKCEPVIEELDFD